jgi:hypothetical protein
MSNSETNNHIQGGEMDHSISFPWKLHQMLETAEIEGFDHVVSWHPVDHSFKVHDVNEFLTHVMPRYFNSTKYKSFQRQLNIWGFERITQRGPAFGGCRHAHFVRGNPSLCRSMKRTKVKGTGGRRRPVGAPPRKVRAAARKSTQTKGIETQTEPSSLQLPDSTLLIDDLTFLSSDTVEALDFGNIFLDIFTTNDYKESPCSPESIEEPTLDHWKYVMIGLQLAGR